MFITTAIVKIRTDQKYAILCKAKTNHEIIIITRTLTRVTVCLYVNPNCRARSLSTIIAVSVLREIPHRIALQIMYCTFSYYAILSGY